MSSLPAAQPCLNFCCVVLKRHCCAWHCCLPGVPGPCLLQHMCAVLPLQVYGNLNDNSGTGVCFTRNPATGEKGLYGEYLANAQGEDVVAGGCACLRSSVCACAYTFLTAAVPLETCGLHGLQTTHAPFPPPLTTYTLTRPTSPCILSHPPDPACCRHSHAPECHKDGRGLSNSIRRPRTGHHCPGAAHAGHAGLRVSFQVVCVRCVCGGRGVHLFGGGEGGGGHRCCTVAKLQFTLCSVLWTAFLWQDLSLRCLL
jgi:hypothetical protein